MTKFTTKKKKELDHKENWALKNWCFWTVLLEKTLRRSNQSILKEISPEYSLEGLMLKLHYFGHLIQRTDSPEKTLMLGRLKARGEGDDRGWDGWMASPARWAWIWASSGRWWWTGRPGVLQSIGSQRVGHDWVTELSWKNWIELKSFSTCNLKERNVNWFIGFCWDYFKLKSTKKH